MSDNAVRLVLVKLQHEYGFSYAYAKLQIELYRKGNRGPQMHDATLVLCSQYSR